MNALPEPLLRIPETVREDVLAYRGRAEQFLRGDVTPLAFRAYRVPMGIYEQRRDGRFMVRVRLGAGQALPHELACMAELSKAYGNGVLHLTTRQDIQIHDVSLEHTSDVLEGLLEAGLSSRGGGGNTVRNVSACPRAGVCPKEAFDTAPYAVAVAEYLLQHRSSFNLPRKYKIAFSGCANDCAMASVTDLGFFAVERDGIGGFAVFAGGGLGGNAQVGIRIEEFIKQEEVFEVAEAIRRLFDKHGNRANRYEARLRYVLDRMSPEEFTKLYREEREALHAQGLQGDVPAFRDLSERFVAKCPAAPAELTSPNVIPEKTPGRYTLRVRLALGDIAADDLTEVGRIAERYGDGRVRVMQVQDLLITGVSGAGLPDAVAELQALPARAAAPPFKVVACAGASTCKLGICLSRGLAAALTDALVKQRVPAGNVPTIRVSGCANSCGGHQAAALGFEGTVRRHNDRLLPCYNVLADGKPSIDGARLARRVGTIPAKLAPKFVAELLLQGGVTADVWEERLEAYDELPDELPDEYYFDFGATEPFSMAGRSAGECSANIRDVIQADIDASKESLATGLAAQGRERDEAFFRSFASAARSLLVIFKLDLTKEDIFVAFKQHLIEPGWVKPQTREILNATLDWRSGRRPSLGDFAEPLRELVSRVEDLFTSLDGNLKFRVPPYEAIAPGTAD